MELKCPECGGDMVFEGYRPLFPACEDCDEVVFFEDCVEQ